MRHLFATITMAALTAAAPAGQAGDPAAAQQRVAALKDALAANKAALRQYHWTETTEVSLKGEVKKRETKLCYYGADGKVVKTPLGDQPAPPKQDAGGRRGGRLKKHIVEKKVGEIKDYMQQVAALVHEYVPPDREKVQAAQAAGHVALKPPADAGGDALLTITDYEKPGDSLAIGLDPAAKALTSYDVQSYVEDPKDDQVTLRVAFDRLADGTSYPQRIVLDVQAKHITVVVTNSGYAKRD